MVKHTMKDEAFQSQQAILDAVTKIWDELTFADVHRVFQK
jgi:hypothetical protein